MTSRELPADPNRRTRVAVFAGITLALLAGGDWYYRAETENIRQEKYKEIAAIGELKAGQIQQWRKERLSDVGRLARDRFVGQVIAEFLREAGHQNRQADLRERLTLELMEGVHEDALLLTPEGHTLLAVRDTSEPVSPATERAIAMALASGGAVLSDFYRRSDTSVYIDAAAAVRNAAGQPLAVAILRSNAEAYLYPLIQSWPTPSHSAETLLVQREGEQIVFLNELRHRSKTALNLRQPMARTTLPAVQAVLGTQGVFLGKDYRDVEVLANLHPIPGSPWFMVAKVDVDEILAEARYRTSAIGVIVGSFILLVGTATAYGYRRRQGRLFRDLYESERQRKRTGEESQMVLRTAMDGFWVVDMQGRFLEANESYCRIIGYTRDELLAMRISDIEATESPEQTTAHIAAVMRTGSDRFLTRHRGKDGAVLDVEISANYLPSNGGRIFVFVRDITERKRGEAELRLQSAALNAAANAIIITDRHGTIAWINPAFTALTGYSADDAIGRNPRELVKSGVHDQAFYKALWDTILVGHVWHGEVTNRRKDGSLYPEDLTITPVKDARGEVTHFIAIKWDRTEQNRLEAQFLQAQKMETVGRLAGGIAHDFNNLLTVINGTAELASTDLSEGDPLRADLHLIQQAGKRAASLTRQLLAFSRKQILQPSVLNLSTLIAEIQDMLQRLIGEDIDLVVVPAKDVGHVQADPGQIEQAIMNLAVNARDAMLNGGRLTIETRDIELDEAFGLEHPSVQPGPYVMLAISDTGVGMDEATRMRIFEPFFTTKEPGKGTGLGLSTVYGIVKQSGGSIWVYSELGKGTTFTICLPRVGEAAHTGQPARPLTVLTGTETILLVEDDEALRHLATRILKSAGYTVLTASNGGEALLVLDRHEGPVHLMLTDVVMPGISGRDLATRMADAHPGIKVLYTSGYTDDAILRHGVLDDVTHFIGKPYTVAELTRKVREVLDS